MKRKLLPLTLLLSACSAFTPAPLPVVYDLGPAPAEQIEAPVQLLDVSAPSWLDGVAMAYRLEYADSRQRQTFRDSRWLAPPAELLAARLRQRLQARGEARPLRIELESFEQDFSAPAQSEVRIRLRARLGGATVTERVFEARLAGGAEAASGVQALARASDALTTEVLNWAAQAR
ncbi:MAG TPA: ABC transporter [Burkholderiaceae bacterium]|jgi:cholesterol transport system auxiliary component